jgi:flagellar biosynthesis/type III secretory pathway M-ring protein FliF/YscJ
VATWIWIVIAIGALLVLGVLVFGSLRAREKRLTERREQAQELRQEADRRARVAEGHELEAREARREAAQVGARADRLDPDRETPSDDD